MSSIDRSTLVATSFFGATFNFVLASHLFGAWRSLPWEPASEWEGSGFSLDRDGARLICGLFSAYFTAASAISMFGLAGIIKRIPPFLRIYRNYLIGDFAFFTLVSCLASSATIDPSSRSNICEHISRQQDFLRDAVDLGLNAENCEQWFERGVMVFMAVLLFVIMIRLHFIFAVSRYYTQLVRSERSMHGAVPSTSSGLQFRRVYILPDQSRGDKELGCVDAPLYAPVPLAQVSSGMAKQLRANAEEVWVSRVQSPPQRVPSHSTDRQVTHSLVHQSPSFGPVHLTDEKL
ncbi:hypothetical protein SCLCIDRAFT_737180 [Scleroderma citrinum Foug A]|uniref:Uncharacterized protein n=1 Tax=Scleroderma citrinum Foug A TaxID=1036808 RepID=A0A0C3AFJ4_9AGAM|nr:hypothetical protein SCLCIDRAFT_737180 [Scleroderma citrinum Foug A]